MPLRKVNIDWPLVLCALALTTFGILMVYSAGVTDRPTRSVANAWKLQLVWFAISLIAAFALSRASVRMIEWLTVPLYGLAIFLLVIVLIPGLGSGGGTAESVHGWLTIGGKRLGQPAEFAKLSVVLMLARVLAQFRTSPKSMFDLWKPIVVVGVPLVLIMKQPDLGTGIVFVGIFFLMLFWTGVPWKLLVLLASPVVSLVLAFNSLIWGAWLILVFGLLIWYRPYLTEGIIIMMGNVITGISSPILWDSLKPYQQDRLLVFVRPDEADPRRAAYHVTQSRVAIGSGGWTGHGFTHGPQKRLAFLPEQHTDFIFAVVGEELGYIGVGLALALFLFLFLRIIRISERANDSFSSLVAFGLLGSWFTHVLENVGMTLNLMPITGIPLPFFSYGGSFLLASWMAIGILTRISSEGRGGGAGQLRI
jgi:rod shape determining protein RodA